MKLKITWDETLVTQRTHARMLRDNVRSAIYYHRDVVLPRHFTLAGARKYKYSPRSQRTKIKKYKKYKHQLPNVMTGKMREIVLSQSKVTGTQYGGRLYCKNYFPLDARRRYEIEQVTADEEQGTAKRIEKGYAKSVKDPNNQRKRRVKISRK